MDTRIVQVSRLLLLLGHFGQTLHLKKLGWVSWMPWYVGSPSNLVRKVIWKEDLISVALNMVLCTHFLWWILVEISTLCGSEDENLVSNNVL